MTIELGTVDTLLYLYLDCVKRSIIRQHTQCLNEFDRADVDEYQRFESKFH